MATLTNVKLDNSATDSPSAVLQQSQGMCSNH